MKRYCMLMHLKPDRADEYVKVHKECWDEHMRALKGAGADELLIWRSGTLVVLFVQCEDLDLWLKNLNTYPINAKWQAMVADFCDNKPRFEEANDAGALEKIFDLNQQLKGSFEPY